MRSPRDLCPLVPKGFALAITSFKVWGTVVTGTVPTLAKLPDKTIFCDLNSETETSTCGLFRTSESASVNNSLISSIVFPATFSIPALG